MEPVKFYACGFLYNPKTKSVLLHRRDYRTKINPGKWAFFGGMSEPGEKPEQTFIRELKEELAIDIAPERLVPLRDYFNEQQRIHTYVFIVESTLTKSQMRLGEGADFDWVPLDRTLDYDLTEHSRADLEFFHRTKGVSKRS